MIKNIFSSDRYFIFYAYDTGHSQLLLRFSKTEQVPYNIDIIFLGVHYMQIPVKFRGITIELLTEDDIPTLNETVTEFLSYSNAHLFRLVTKGVAYYVAGSFVHVYENELEPGESSVGLPRHNQGREKRIATSVVNEEIG